MDLSKLKPADFVIFGAAFILLIAIFLPWYSLDTGFGTASRNGLDYFFTGVVPLLIAIALVVLVIITELTDVDVPDLPFPFGLVYLAGGGLATFLVFIRLVFGDGVDFVGLDRSIGLFLAFLACIGLGVGGLLKVLDEGGLDQLKGGGPGGFGQGPQQPPQPF